MQIARCMEIDATGTQKVTCIANGFITLYDYDCTQINQGPTSNGRAFAVESTAQSGTNHNFEVRVNDMPSDPHLFTVRVWREEVGSGQYECRGRVQHGLDGQAWHFQGWAAMIDFMHGVLCTEPSDDDTTHSKPHTAD